MSLVERLRLALAREGHHTPINGDEYDHAAGVYKPAAVLIAITDRTEPGLLLTLRQPHLRRHAGQIAFPGGRIDPEDRDAVAAALREAQEEIGLDPAAVAIVGTSDTYRIGSGYSVTPVIGVIPPDLALAPHEPEVAALFETPLTFLLEPGNHAVKSMIWQGRERHFHEIVWEDRRIWGATANMIVNLARRLAGALP
ncbi:MAG TPA: CoA pyrophosphatase [Sphingomonas sp.]|nr:CoA pyrophosphatase [Sphingomonas sp.]